MAFQLLDDNLTGFSIIDQPGGVNATTANFIDPYDYATQYKPELIPRLHMANGLGKITGFCRITGQESTYESDQIQHAEENRLHNILKEVELDGTTFTSPTNHNLRVKQTIKISDGETEAQATVTAITSATVFEATNDAGVAFDLTGPVDIIADFSNSWEKGSENFTVSRRWDPTFYKNYSHIIKEFYDVNGSDMVHCTWVTTPDGPRWFNHEMMRTSNLFDNLVEMTHLFHERKATGDARGLNGVIPQIETRGNIGNEYITDIEDLANIARRAKQQGTCREFTCWSDHQQMWYFDKMLAAVNSGQVNGSAATYFGAFNNSADMALKLGFTSVEVTGVTFHFTPWALLEDPTLMGNNKFLNTNIATLIVPTGSTYVQENGNTVEKPYLTLRYRSDANYNRKKEVKIFGPNGTAQVRDAQSVHYLTEMTNQVVGANNYFVVRRGNFFTP